MTHNVFCVTLNLALSIYLYFCGMQEFVKQTLVLKASVYCSNVFDKRGINISYFFVFFSSELLIHAKKLLSCGYIVRKIRYRTLVYCTSVVDSDD